MAWSMPNTGPWNPAMGFPGPYSVKEWTDMQQHNWQEWAQWQQQYSQWQNQYGEKLAQQYQMQHMGNMPLMFPMNPTLPPAPPPPNDPPPPPPHENDQPLFAQSAVQPTPVPPPPNQQWNPSNYPNTNAEKKSAKKTSGLNPNWSTINVEPQPQVINMEALKKLAEEERLFDIQFKQWEEEIDKWRKDNINHPDKDAYKEYEKKFETCRAQLMERRNQMKLQRSKLLGNTQSSKTTMQTNTSASVPQQLSASKKNYNEVTSQNYHNSPMQNYESHNDTNYKNQQFKNTYNKNSKIKDPQDSYESYQDMNEDMSYSPSESQPSKNSANFLPTASSNKDIPGLDLVLDSEKTSTAYKSQDVLKTEGKVNNQNAGEKPDYSTISQGINNILGDEKIMNILSMVRNNNKPNILSLMENASQNLNFSRDSPHSNIQNNIPSYSEDRCQNNRNNQQAHRQSHDYSNQYNQKINLRYPQKRQFDERANIPIQHEQQYDNYQDNRVNDQKPAFYERNAPQDEPPLRQIQARPPFQDISAQNMNNYSRDIPDIRHIQTNIIPPLNQSVKPKWVEEPLFTPSIIVEYEHKPLRLKARDFIEPVHMFDYNHKSKNGSSKKVDYYKEVDELFTKRNHWERDNNETRVQNSSRDFERRSLKENVNDDYHSKVNFERRLLDGRHSDRKYGLGLFDRDRYSRRDDHTRERERDHFRNKGDSRDFARDDKDLKRSDRDFSTDTRDFEREDNRDYKKDISRNLSRDISRDVRDLRRDDNRDSRDYKRDSCRTSRDVGRNLRDYKREDSRDYRRSSSNSSRDVSRDYSRDDRDLKHSDGYFRRDERDYERNAGRDNKRCSRSRERNFRKRSHSHDSDIETVSKVSKAEEVELSIEEMKYIVMIDDLLEPPGREMRPEKIAIILRGVPGSGKSYLAKLIRDKEAEYGGAARIMSIDDYFMQEVQIEEKDPSSGKIIKKPVMKYEYDANLEESYFNSLKKAFKRSVTDGYFSFLIFDAVNEFLKSYADVWNFSRQNGFQVYVCTMEADVQTCFKRNIHNRSLKDIEALSECFFKTPAHHIQLDATTLLQSAAITEVHMEDVKDDVESVETQELEVENVFTSKWEKMDSSAQLARLDGTSKPLRSSQLTMEDYLQSDDWKPNLAKPGKKTVRWADIEERRQQEKMRAIGFVVGQTDWNRMTDPTLGSSALTQTKYIERVRRN